MAPVLWHVSVDLSPVGLAGSFGRSVFFICPPQVLIKAQEERANKSKAVLEALQVNKEVEQRK